MVLAVGYVAAMSLCVHGAAAQESVTVFCASARMELAMAGVVDSTEDVIEALRDKEALEIAESPDSADIVVVVFGRESIYDDSKIYFVVYAMLQAADQTIPLQGIAGPFRWKSAAGNLARKVEDIAKTNYERLMLAREVRDTAAESPAREPAQAEVTRGMSPADVRGILGDATRHVKFEGTSLWDYGALQVVFDEGKVVDMKF